MPCISPLVACKSHPTQTMRACGDERAHQARVAGVAAALLELPEWRARNGSDWLVINAHYDWSQVMNSGHGKEARAREATPMWGRNARFPGVLETGHPPAVLASVDRDAGMLKGQAEMFGVQV